ncbi:hypothetical protein JKF63_00356 [Porcisia hertigi]|uniref:Uncharacterized protein n=1 Tax=Porcisia hertigi TaxID=2761500 RepID=A0A836KY94_9TRYP|nr:hypothetical protein JKF63_00356 [Porcisia hertigi]
MVLIVVKGAHYPDEFTVERALTDALSSPQQSPKDTAETRFSSACSSPVSKGTIVPVIAHILNKRHHVRLMLLSAQELATLWPQHYRSDGTAVMKPEERQELEEVVERYKALIGDLNARLKDAKNPVSADEFDNAERELRALTVTLYPSLCTHRDGPEAAVQELYAKHEDPDLDDDTRLVVYHCRALLDPEWKANERVNEDEAALWFCGKPMEATLSKYCGRNEKSKIIVRVSPRNGPAPSSEPRMRYEDQRALYRAMCLRREEYKQLEDSELRDRVVQQCRGTDRLLLGAAEAARSRGTGARTLMSTAAGACSPTALCTDGLRPIFPRREERELPIS